jgi:signal transduction histidine kinase
MTVDNRIDGTVISVYDIDALKKSAVLVEEARDYAESILEATRNCLVVLGADRRVRSANRAFYDQFKMAPRDIEGCRLEDVGVRQWDVPALMSLLDGVGNDAPAGDLRIEREFPEIGWRIVLASARLVPKANVTLLTFVDITARAQMERRIADYQSKLQKMAFQAALVEERERRRIAHDLHDHIGQSLALARMKLDSVRGAASGDVKMAIVAAVDLIVKAVADTRSLIFDLSPPVLYDLGLKAALSWLSDEIEKRAGVRVEIIDDGRRPPFEDAIAALLFRAVRELLTNVFKHAETQTVRVVLAHEADDFVIDVQDAGVGFDSEMTAQGPPSGFGLFSVREQIGRLGGTVTIASTPGRGTQVRLRIPLLMKKPTPYPGTKVDEDSAGR